MAGTVKCQCGHPEVIHLFGSRGGVRVRTRCSHVDQGGECPCRVFVAARKTSDERDGAE